MPKLFPLPRQTMLTASLDKRQQATKPKDEGADLNVDPRLIHEAITQILEINTLITHNAREKVGETKLTCKGNYDYQSCRTKVTCRSELSVG